MDRREYLRAFACVLLAAPLFARAQPARKVYRIGALSLTSFGSRTLGGILSEALARRGYVDGRDYVIVERNAEGQPDRLPALAADLVRLNVDVIVAGPAVAITAAHDATLKIPIVMAFSASDPIKSGFVMSLARPGGNVTGLTALAGDLTPKMLDVLRDAVPGITRVAILANPSRPEHAAYLGTLRAAPPTGLQLQPFEAKGPEQYEAAFAAMTKERAEGLVILGDVMFTRDSARLAELALAHRLPSVYLFSAYVEAGGLLANGPSEPELLDLAADYVDKILKGANPADMPVQQPKTFNLSINMKTAKALGITIPKPLEVQAKEVIR
jgi:putative ABC transport system substrate-binding protein